MKSLLWVIYERWSRLGALLRGMYLTALVRACGGSVGTGLRADRGVRLRHAPTDSWRLGSRVFLGAYVVLDVTRSGRLEIGDNSKIMSGSLVGVEESVVIGSDVLIAECASVRDADHGIALGVNINTQPVRARAVTIGDDVWIGRGAAVLAGSTVESGAVIGANAVVKGRVGPNDIQVGPKAQLLRHREAAR